MYMKQRAVYISGSIATVVIILASISLAGAQGTSNNFRIDESFIGPGGNLESSSTNFQLQTGQQSLGNIGVGTGESSSFQIKNGSVTTPDPTLSCVLSASNINFGSFSTVTPATSTATFSVLNYTSFGYVISILGDTPTNGSHNLTNMASNGASSAGTEQFGINLVANTSPVAFGSDPVQVPDNSFSFGNVAANYNTTNSFRYNNGETIANAVKSSGITDYTISYLVNVNNATPPGAYTGNQTVLCTGTY